MACDMQARAFFFTYPTPCAIKAWALKARAFLCMARDSEKKSARLPRLQAYAKWGVVTRQ